MALPDIKSDWANVLTDFVAGYREEVVPAGWLTKNQVAVLWRKSPTYANKVLKVLIVNGQAEKKNFTIRLQKKDSRGKLTIGHCRSVPHYRLTSRGRDHKV